MSREVIVAIALASRFPRIFRCCQFLSLLWIDSELSNFLSLREIGEANSKNLDWEFSVGRFGSLGHWIDLHVELLGGMSVH